MAEKLSMSTKELQTTPPCENLPEDKAVPIRHKVHCVMMNKGGVGKTIVSMNLVQYLRDKGQTVQAIDLDPMNHTMAEYKGLQAKPVEMFAPGLVGLKGREIDGLASSMLTTDASFVVDNGSTGFIQMGSYLAETEFAELLAARSREFFVHAVIAGGDMMSQCILGLNTILESFPTSVRVVVWLNEHSGPAEFDSMRFQDMRIYKDNGMRWAGIVNMPALKPLFLQDFIEMQRRRLTYAEAISSPDFNIMNQQRLVMIRRAIWQQLDGIL